MADLSPDTMRGVWSATPTPFTPDLEVDAGSVRRLIEHHVRMGVRGLFLAGTCGEGPWMPDRQREELFRIAADACHGRMILAAQATDNSAARILDNIERMERAGVQIAVVAPPFFLLNATPENVLHLYREVIDNSPLPVGIYDRGTAGPVVVDDDVLREILRQPRVVLLKDSSGSPARRDIALEVRRQREGDLVLLDGDEFHCVDWLVAGYDGLLLGGGVFNAPWARRIVRAVREGRTREARAVQEEMNRIMWAVYGGRDVQCWLAGLKYLLVRLGVFSSDAAYLRYPLTDDCRRAVEQVLPVIARGVASAGSEEGADAPAP